MQARRSIARRATQSRSAHAIAAVRLIDLRTRFVRSVISSFAHETTARAITSFSTRDEKKSSRRDQLSIFSVDDFDHDP
jgi:hypothetical protein